jgi:hypothetical protein
MRSHIGAGIVGMVLVASVVSLSAHHTVASLFDTTNLVTLKGTLTEVEWKNPHVFLHLDTRGDDGGTVAWTVETLNLQGLSRVGLNQDSLKVGDVLSMTVCVKKDGARWAVTDAIAMPGGTAYVRVGGC